MVLEVTSVRLVPSAQQLLLVQSVSPVSSAPGPSVTLVLLVTSPPLVPSVEHMYLIEPVSASPSPCLSHTVLLVITVSPSRAFRGTLASG